ncbi:HAD-superfamily hydrolase, subfamily IIB [Trichlorobacter thiogenes]|uniref:HAD-superfamily hydrolase, subfamily IIB n=1 Tax=Trichlorobacter thiogenes TaxID=115783 RepID=A0A1T4KPM2_9BACT|nr:HAD-superfamily hydrolase, subfamily IIB [Trichlorobacter thiogenes]
MSIIGVGSGGSFTVASLLCNLHEAYTGRVSRPSTPLEIICNPTLSSASPVFLISAEGKNPDIIEALLRARSHSARSVHVLTNRQDSPLTQSIAKLTDINTHVFNLTQKDGYLATNSLLMDAVLVARAYGELDGQKDQFPLNVCDLTLNGQPIQDWLDTTDEFVKEVVSRGNVIVTYSPLLTSIAADLESKLAEAALLHCQLADIRSFAHGRHLWLAERSSDCAILALVEPSLEGLWSHMRTMLPSTIPTLTMSTGSGAPWDLIAGLVAQMYLVSRIAREIGKDPGRPTVPQFGRDLYYADLHKFIPKPIESDDRGERSKYEVLGARWPSKFRYGSMRRNLNAYKIELERQKFKAIVFDYDGTLCTSQRKDAPPPESILNQLTRLADAGIIVGIASGRGGSIQEHLRNVLPKNVWPQFKLGLYNGGWITSIDGPEPSGKDTSEFLSHVTRIVRGLKNFGVPIETIRTTQPYQVSIRFLEGIATDQMWFVIADALRHAGLDLSRMVRSKHSVDVLAGGVGKSRLIAQIIQESKIDPYHILTMGDQGAWPGNDSALLEHKFSLSVDLPSRRIDRGWKLSPPHKRDVDATIWYLERIQLLPESTFSICITDNIISETDREPV